MGVLLPRGYYPEEKDVRRINDLIDYNEYINDNSKCEIAGFSLIEASKINEFRCGRCSKLFHVFIGDMFNKIPNKALKIIESHI